MPVANNPTSYDDQNVEYQEDPYGGDPTQHAVKAVLEQMAQETYGKELGALTREEFEPLLQFVQQNRDKIKQMVAQGA